MADADRCFCLFVVLNIKFEEDPEGHVGCVTQTKPKVVFVEQNSPPVAHRVRTFSAEGDCLVYIEGNCAVN